MSREKKYRIAAITTWHLLSYVDLVGHHQQIIVNKRLAKERDGRRRTVANQIWTNLQMEDYQLTIWKKQTTQNMAIFNLYLNQESGLHRQTSITRMQWRFQLEWARIAAQIERRCQYINME